MNPTLLLVLGIVLAFGFASIVGLATAVVAVDPARLPARLASIRTGFVTVHLGVGWTTYRWILAIASTLTLTVTQMDQVRTVVDSRIAANLGPGRLVGVGLVELALVAWGAYVGSSFLRAADRGTPWPGIVADDADQARLTTSLWKEGSDNPEDRRGDD